jgi:hypothetical protein
MAPTTRRTSRITPPPTHAEAHEANTVKETRFFTIYDKDHTSRSLRSIAADANTTEGTGRRWLKQRENMGSLAYRHTRPMSKKLGKPSKVTVTARGIQARKEAYGSAFARLVGSSS